MMVMMKQKEGEEEEEEEKEFVNGIGFEHTDNHIGLSQDAKEVEGSLA